MSDKPFEEKNILERHTYTDGKFNLASALGELDIRYKDIEERMRAVEEALAFFVNWYKTTQEVNILVPSYLAHTDDQKTSGGLIL